MPDKVYSISNLEVKELSIVVWGANNKGFYAIKELGQEDNENIFWLAKGEKMGEDNTIVNDPKKDVIDKNADPKNAEPKAKTDKEATPKVEPVVEPVAKEELSKEELIQKFAMMEASNKILMEKLEKAEKNTANERAIRIEKEFIQKAKDEFGFLGDHTKLGKALVEIDEKLSKESKETVMEVLKGAQEKIKKGDLFKEMGSDNAQSAKTGHDKIDAMAKELMNKEKIDYTTALEKVFRENEELYKEYMEEEI